MNATTAAEAETEQAEEYRAEVDAILAAFRRPTPCAAVWALPAEEAEPLGPTNGSGFYPEDAEPPTYRCSCGTVCSAYADYCPRCHRSFND